MIAKEILYPTEWLFEQQYYNSKFSDSKDIVFNLGRRQILIYIK